MCGGDPYWSGKRDSEGIISHNDYFSKDDNLNFKYKRNKTKEMTYSAYNGIVLLLQ